jgi:hypothetical protein
MQDKRQDDVGGSAGRKNGEGGQVRGCRMRQVPCDWAGPLPSRKAWLLSHVFLCTAPGNGRQLHNQAPK